MIYAPAETDFDVMTNDGYPSPQPLPSNDRPDLGDVQREAWEGYGINCPHCGAAHCGINKEVLRTNPKGRRGCILRRRRCRVCNKEFSTKETVIFSQ